ncbi:tRNA dimethylallyltransferase [Bradyrhizobium sp. GM0.4]
MSEGQVGRRHVGKAVLIAGPTASGKSALALELALAAGGVVINADSMQVYRDLRIITARPTLGDEAQVPHRLYGHVDAAVNFSAGAWVGDAAKALEAAKAEGRLPIFIGGTGLYFKALTAGLSVVPPIPLEVREDVRARLERNGVEALHDELAASDPRAAERLNRRDRTRIARALEVVEATGRSLLDWHHEGQPPLLPKDSFRAVFLAPRARRALCAHRRPLRRHVGCRRARGGGASRRPKPRSAAAGDEGSWRAGANPASAR